MKNTQRNPEVTKLMAEINGFISVSGMSRTAFGVWVANDPNLIRNLEGGRDPRWKTIQSIREKMADSAAAGPASA